MCRAALGDPTHARDSFERSVEVTPPQETRSQYLHRSYLLRSQVASRSWAEAATTIEQLKPLAIQVASNRTARLIRATLSAETVADPPPSFTGAGAELLGLLDGPAS